MLGTLAFNQKKPKTGPGTNFAKFVTGANNRFAPNLLFLESNNSIPSFIKKFLAIFLLCSVLQFSNRNNALEREKAGACAVVLVAIIENTFGSNA